MPFKVKIGQKIYTVRDKQDLECSGEICWEDGTIDIRPKQGAKCRLDTVIHELAHALYPRWSEARVKRLARVMAEGLWADRWRRRNPKNVR